MAKYIGPVCRLCRREGGKLFLKGDKCHSIKCVLEKRKTPPGQISRDRRMKKLSDYGIRLREKQKARRIYGIMEKQFRHYFSEAARQPGVTGENLLRLLERRLDNVVFRMGLASSRRQARQLVVHRHVQVNGRPVNIPSRLVRVGDVVNLRPRSQNLSVIESNRAAGRGRELSWLQRGDDGRAATVIGLPGRADIDTDVNEQLIVEYYSR